MNCREICPEQSQTTNRAQILTQTSPHPVMLLLQAAGWGSGNRDVAHHPALALGIPEGRCLPAFLAAQHSTGRKLSGHRTAGRASQSLPQVASGLLRTAVEQEHIFKLIFFFFLVYH